MKFLTCEIDHVKNHMYEQLLDAWENSVKQNAPTAEYERKYLDPADYPQAAHVKNSYLANSVKLNYWADKVKQETGNLCFIDGDTVVLKDVAHVFDLDFDIAYTRRSPGVHIPINGGVLFVKPSETVSDFFHKWVLTNNEMLVNKPLHRHWYRKYNGINQAAFGHMLEKYDRPIKIIELPCAKYNACDKVDWENMQKPEFAKDVHILHVKSQLRVACLNNIQIKGFSNAIQTWKKYDIH